MHFPCALSRKFLWPRKFWNKTQIKLRWDVIPCSAIGTAARKPDGQPADKNRRRLIWGLLGGYLGINFLMFLRFFFPRALYEPNTSVNIGFPSAFQQGVNQEFLQSNRLWVVLEPGRLVRDFRAMHAPGMHAGLAAATKYVSLPVPRKRIRSGRRQFRGPRAAAHGPMQSHAAGATERFKWTQAISLCRIRAPE